MIQTTTTTEHAPGADAAIAYVRDALASYPGAVTICGTIAPGRDSSGPLQGTRDVLFLLAGETGQPNRFTIWHEADALYGEW